MITSRDFEIMKIKDNEKNIKDAVDIVNGFYNQKENVYDYYKILENNSTHPLYLIHLAKNFHLKFAEEMSAW